MHIIQYNLNYLGLFVNPQKSTMASASAADFKTAILPLDKAQIFVRTVDERENGRRTVGAIREDKRAE